jgi:diphosphomevalonate decarboxylase
LYWRPGTLAALHTIEQLKAAGVPVFATMDAGPQLKAVCLPEASEQVARALRETEGVQQVVDVGLGRGAWIEEPAS